MTPKDTEQLVDEIKQQLNTLSTYTAEIGSARASASKTQDAATQVVDMVTSLTQVQTTQVNNWDKRLEATRVMYELAVKDLVEHHGELQEKLSQELDAKASAQQADHNRLLTTLLLDIKREHSHLIDDTRSVLSTFSDQVSSLDETFDSMLARQRTLMTDQENFHEAVRKSNELGDALSALQYTQAELINKVLTTGGENGAAINRLSLTLGALEATLHGKTEAIAARAEQTMTAILGLDARVNTQDLEYRALLAQQSTRQAEVFDAMLAEADKARKLTRIWQWCMLGGAAGLIGLMGLLLGR